MRHDGLRPQRNSSAQLPGSLPGRRAAHFLHNASVRKIALVVFVASASTVVHPSGATAGIVVTQTIDSAELANALSPSGLTITSISIRNGSAVQFGTFSDFTLQPITIGDGIVLSSGNVTRLGPPADPVLDFPQPSTDVGTNGTAEFDAYGPGHIENFGASFNVAALLINFHLDDESQIQFDFVFGSVEFPFWTSSYTDSFLAFLDGTGDANQITYDAQGAPVQVGKSFSGLVSTADVNTAFGGPHGVLGLTTTTASLDAGDHTLLFEIGDVNDGILDSAVFIANLRTGVGQEGTELTDPEDYDLSEIPEPASLTLMGLGSLGAFFGAFGRRRVPA